MSKTRRMPKTLLLCATVLVLTAWSGTARPQPEIIVGPIDCTVANAIPYTPALVEFELLDPEDNEIPFPGFDYTPCGVGDPGPAALWFAVTGSGNVMKASTCENSSEGWANFDTQVGVYCQGCQTSTCVAGNDDEPGCNFHSTVEFCSQPGEEYLIHVSGFQGAFGQGALSITDSGTPCTAEVECAVVREGACCVDTCSDPQKVDCLVMCEECCNDMGGHYQGDDSECVGITSTDDRIFLAYPDQSIPDGDPAGLTLSIQVGAEDSCIVGDVDVELLVSHSWIGDLIVDFSGPIAPGEDNVITNLFNRSCGSTNDMNVLFDDAGGSPLCSAMSGPDPVPLRPPWYQNPPCGSTPGPEPCTWSPPDLGTFEGKPSQGTWVLLLQDVFAGDAGTVEAWGLHIDCADSVCAVDDEGDDEGGDTADNQLQVSGRSDDVTVLDARRSQDEDRVDDDRGRGLRGRRKP